MGEEEQIASKPKEGDNKTVTRLVKKKEIKKKEKPKKKKKRKYSTDSESDSSDSSKSTDSDSDDSKSSNDDSSDSDSDSDSDSSSDSDSDSGSDSNSSSTDSEEEEKGHRRHKKKKKGKKEEKPIEVEELSEDFKEEKDLKWEVEEIPNKKGGKDKKYKFVIDELRDNTAYAVRVRGKNASGWGLYTKPLKVQTPKMLLASKILKNKESSILLNKILNKKLRRKKFKLLFRASKHGFAGTTFHSMCNGKGATLVIVASTTGNIFGGYTSMPWASTNQYCVDHKSFLFLLKSAQKGVKPQVFNLQNATNSVYHHSSYGPTWGSNHDLHICNNCNSANGSYTNLGGSFANTAGSQHILAGSRNFMVKDYEVWLLK